MSANNKDYADDNENFANEPVLQTTLRELQGIISNPRFWIGFGAVAALLTITGPFGTLESLETAQRLVYWATISFVTFFAGSAIATIVSVFLSRRNYPNWLIWIISGVAAGPVVGTFSWLITINIFGMNIDNTFSFLQFIAYATGIAIMVVTLNFLVSNVQTPQEAADPHTPPISPFLARLPKNLGKTLISLEAQDHYINVKTTKGSEMILMRLGDAEKELDAYPGLRVHRSWWVATDAIDKVERGNGKVDLVMNDGVWVPVSRSYVKALTEAGIK